jgi:hypothetical protein
MYRPGSVKVQTTSANVQDASLFPTNAPLFRKSRSRKRTRHYPYPHTRSIPSPCAARKPSRPDLPRRTAAPSPPAPARSWPQALEAAALDLDTTDDRQESSKQLVKGVTSVRNFNISQLHETLVAIQNAADLQWPARNPLNAEIRGEFRFNQFPPKYRNRRAAQPVESQPQTGI